MPLSYLVLFYNFISFPRKVNVPTIHKVEINLASGNLLWILEWGKVRWLGMYLVL